MDVVELSPRSVVVEMRDRRVAANKFAQGGDYWKSDLKNNSGPTLRKDFEWSLKPVLTLMQSIGIPLEISNSTSQHLMHSSNFDSTAEADGQSSRRKAFVVLSFVLFFFNVLCQGYAIVREIPYLSDGSTEMVGLGSKFSSTALWSRYIETINNIVSSVASHALVLCLCFTSWRWLVRVLHRIEQQRLYSESDYETFRKATYTALGLGVMEMLFWLVILGMSIPVIETVKEKVFVTCSVFYTLHTFLPLYLFIGLCSLAQSALLLLSKDVELSHRENNNKTAAYYDSSIKCLPADAWRRRLNAWRLRYYWAGELVHSISRCFGPFLAVSVASFFVRMINSSFSFLTLVRTSRDNEGFSGRVSLHLSLLAKDFFTFCVAVYTPQHVRQQAIDVNKMLQKLQFDDTNLQSQVDFLKLEISLTLPRITAFGFFDMDCHLIPTFVGTTLTYLIILFQFETTENKTA